MQNLLKEFETRHPCACCPAAPCMDWTEDCWRTISDYLVEKGLWDTLEGRDELRRILDADRSRTEAFQSATLSGV